MLYYTQKNAIFLAQTLLTLCISALTICSLSSCSKKTNDSYGSTPDFSLTVSGISLHGNAGTFRIRRFGGANENPKIELRTSADTETFSKLHRRLFCDGIDIQNEHLDFQPNLAKFSLSKETFPLLASLHQVADCLLTVMVENKEGSTHKSVIRFRLIQDSPAALDITVLEPDIPMVGNKPFLLEAFKIKNPGSLPINYSYNPQTIASIRKLFRYTTIGPISIPDGATGRFTSRAVNAAITKIEIGQDTFEGPPRAHEFTVESNQTLTVRTWAQFPGGCPSIKVIADYCISGGVIHRYYLGGQLNVFNNGQSLTQWQKVDMDQVGEEALPLKTIQYTKSVFGNIPFPPSYLSDNKDPIAAICGASIFAHAGNVINKNEFGLSPEAMDCSGTVPDSFP